MLLTRYKSSILINFFKGILYIPNKLLSLIFYYPPGQEPVGEGGMLILILVFILQIFLILIFGYILGIMVQKVINYRRSFEKL